MQNSNEKLGCQIGIRFDAATHARIKQAADKDGIKVADLIRRLTVWALKPCEELSTVLLLKELTVTMPKVKRKAVGA
jgi:hypothetical protein